MSHEQVFLEIGSRIREVRGTVTQDAFAKRLNVVRKTVVRWEAGSAIPDGASLLALFLEFGAEPRWVLTGERGPVWEDGVFAGTAKTVAEMEPSGSGPLHAKLAQARLDRVAQQTDRRSEFIRLEQALSSCTDEDFALLMSTTSALARRLATGRAALPPAVPVKKPAKNAA